MCRTHSSTMLLKVKVTIEGHKFEPWISYSPSSLPLGYLLNFGQMFASVRQYSAIPTQGQGHNRRSWDIALIFMSAPYLLYPLLINLQSNVHLGEMMCRIHNSTMLTQGLGHTFEGHKIEPSILCLLNIPLCLFKCLAQ